MQYFKIPFGGIVNSKYVLTIRFNNGFNIGISKFNWKGQFRPSIIQFGKYEE